MNDVSVVLQTCYLKYTYYKKSQFFMNTRLSNSYNKFRLFYSLEGACEQERVLVSFYMCIKNIYI